MANQKMTRPLSEQGGLGELKSRLWFVFLAIIVYRIGAHVPVPGVDPAKLADFFNQQKNTILGLFNMFSGGALQRLTVFALNVMPYISASIIVQLMTVVSPRLEEIKKEGESGRRKITQYTRYATVLIATFQALGMAKFLVNSGFTLYGGPQFYITAVMTLVTGTLFLMWLGERMTERGIGNGISLIIFSGIVAGLPAAIARTLEQVREGQLMAISVVLLTGLVVVVMGIVVFIERGQRRITVHYAKRQQGRKMFAAQASHLPLKVNMAGVIPPIFASSIILFPSTISTWFGQGGHLTWLNNFALMLSPGQPLHTVLFAIAIVFFSFFYTALVFNPRDTAENLKKAGAFIPGIRPGEQTARYVDLVMTRLTLVGAIYLLLVALLPDFLNIMWHVPFYFGGTSLLIIIVVLMDFMAQVQAHLMSHKYESLMKKANLKGNSLV
jgi:preprotein translocase subunit SecY